MRFRQLACFIRVCETGSITRAASDLNIAQPALGLQIRGLEHEFGVALIVRSSRGVSPTPEGELVLAWARATLADTDELRRRLDAMKGSTATPSLCLGMTASLTGMMAGPLVEAVTRDLPQLSLNIVEGLSNFVAEWVEDGRVDFALGFGPLETKSVDLTPIMQERLFYLAAPGEPSAPITLAEVLQRPLALPQHSIRDVVEDAARSIGLTMTGGYQIASLQAARDIARRGIAGAIVPFGGVADDFKASELSVRLIVSPTVPRTLYLMHKAGRVPDSVERAFLAILDETLRSAVKPYEAVGAYGAIEAIA